MAAEEAPSPEPPSEHPLPGDWSASPEQLAYAAEVGVRCPEACAAAFCCHYAASGRRLTAAGWDAKFRHWCLREVQHFQPSRGGGRRPNRGPERPPIDPDLDARLAAFAAAKVNAAAAARAAMGGAP